MDRKALLIGIALAGVTASGAWAAQTSTAPTNVSEIVVTAEKRLENIQEVPITMTAVSQRQLTRANVLTTTDLVRTVPSLTASDEGIFQIRSIGTQGFGRSAEHSVYVFLDGVVLALPRT